MPPWQAAAYLSIVRRNVLDIDERIAAIMEKMERLSEKNPVYRCGEFPPKWKEPLSEEKVRDIENRYGIRLPEDYRRFITTVSKGGTQPFYGLRGIDELCRRDDGDDLIANVAEKFQYTLKKPLDVSALSDEEYDRLYDINNNDVGMGFIELCHEGCGMFNILIVNAENKETYGTVWFFDLANDGGIFPLADPASGKAMRFLDWLEYYVDRTLELDDDKYFSYGELTVNSIGVL